MHWRQFLRIRTQDPAFLWRLVIGILLVGAVLAFLVEYLPLRSPLDGEQRIVVALALDKSSDARQMFDEMLADPSVDFELVLDTLPAFAVPSAFDDVNSLELGHVPIDPRRIAVAIQSSPRSAEEQQIGAALWLSLLRYESSSELTAFTQRSPAARYSNYALAVLWKSEDAPLHAAASFEREGRQHNSPRARKQAVEIFIATDDIVSLVRLANDPVFADAFPALARIKIAIALGDWSTVWWQIPQNERDRFQWGAALLALFTGGCWFSIALQSGEVNLPRGARWWICTAAIPLGILSVWPTHVGGIWQEFAWGLGKSSALGPGVRYYVFSVGAREEFCKLLLFLPLVPWLMRRGNELEALIAGACVGLGFAMLENSHYFAASAGSSTLGRFLTANFFHMSATGLVGLALLRALWYPREKGLEFFALFGVIVLAHGFYDATIALPALRDYSIAGSIIYILLAYQFFRELRAMRGEQQETISLTANFLCGISLLTSVTLIYLSARFGFRAAMRMLVPEVLSMALMAYMFLREMPNSLLRTR